MGWIITLAVLILLAIVPLGAKAVYNSEGFFLSVIAGLVRIPIFPSKKKEKISSKVESSESAPQPTPAKQEIPTKPKSKKRKKSGGKITDFLPLVRLVVDFLGSFRRKLRVNHLEMKLILAGGDPCDLAVNYGKAWTALGNLLPLLERCFVIRKRDLQVECDFVSESTTIFARLDITITLGRLLGLVVVYGIRALKEYLKISQKRKAVQ